MNRSYRSVTEAMRAIPDAPEEKPRIRFTVKNPSAAARGLADYLLGTHIGFDLKDKIVLQPKRGPATTITRKDFIKVVRHVLSQTEFVEEK